MGKTTFTLCDLPPTRGLSCRTSSCKLRKEGLLETTFFAFLVWYITCGEDEIFQELYYPSISVGQGLPLCTYTASHIEETNVYVDAGIHTSSYPKNSV